jgi:hypothetical protein
LFIVTGSAAADTDTKREITEAHTTDRAIRVMKTSREQFVRDPGAIRAPLRASTRRWKKCETVEGSDELRGNLAVATSTS